MPWFLDQIVYRVRRAMNRHEVTPLDRVPANSRLKSVFFFLMLSIVVEISRLLVELLS